MEEGGEARKRRESDPESKLHRYAADTLQGVEEEGGRGREEDGLNNTFPMVIRKNVLDSGRDEISSSYQEEEDGGGERTEAGSQEDDAASEATGTEVDEERSLAASQEILKEKGAEEEGVISMEEEEEEEDEWYKIDGSSVPSHDSIIKEQKKKKAEAARTNTKIHRQTDEDCVFGYSTVMQNQKTVFYQYNSTIMNEVKKCGEGIFVCVSPQRGKSFSETLCVELIRPHGDYCSYKISLKQKEGKEYYRSEVVPKNILETFKFNDMIHIRVHPPHFHN